MNVELGQELANLIVERYPTLCGGDPEITAEAAVQVAMLLGSLYSIMLLHHGERHAEIMLNAVMEKSRDNGQRIAHKAVDKVGRQ